MLSSGQHTLILTLSIDCRLGSDACSLAIASPKKSSRKRRWAGKKKDKQWVKYNLDTDTHTHTFTQLYHHHHSVMIILQVVVVAVSWTSWSQCTSLCLLPWPPQLLLLMLLAKCHFLAKKGQCRKGETLPEKRQYWHMQHILVIFLVVMHTPAHT